MDLFEKYQDWHMASEDDNHCPLDCFSAGYELAENHIKQLEAEIKVLKMTVQHYRTGGNVKF